MNMSNFDSLKAAESLQDAGFEVQQAEAVVGTVTQALNENLATQDDLRELGSRLDVLENKVVAIDSRLDAIDHKFEAVNIRLDAIDARFEAIDHKFEAINARLDAIDLKFEAVNTNFKNIYTRLDILDSKIDNLASDLARKLTIRLGGMLLAAIVLLEILNRIFPVVPAP